MIPNLFGETTECDDYLQNQLITYIGNKRKLARNILNYGKQVAADRPDGKMRFLDGFSGSGIISRYMKSISSYIISNDIEDYAQTIAKCFLSNREDIDWHFLMNLLRNLDEAAQNNKLPGFITSLYAPENDQCIKAGERVFYTRRNALYIDSCIEQLSHVEPVYRNLVLGPLLSKASMHVNTGGVFKGYYKDGNGVGAFGGKFAHALQRILHPIQLEAPILSNFSCKTEVTGKDAGELIDTIPQVDLAYFDPPYNQHPYGSNYFMLNLITGGVAPTEISESSGIPTDWKRSPYNKRALAKDALFDLISSVRANYVLISFNNEGYVDFQTMIGFLNRLGDVHTEEIAYNTYRASRNLSARSKHVSEYLFFLKKN